MSRFEAEYALLSEAIDDAFGDVYAFTAIRTMSTGQALEDVSRPTGLTVVCVYVDPEQKPTIPNAYDSKSGRRPEAEATRPELQISPAAALTSLVDATGAAVAVGKGDLFMRLCDGAVYRVFERVDTASGLIRLRVNREG